MSAIPFYKSVYGTHFLAGDSGRSRGLDHRAMPDAPVSYRLNVIVLSFTLCEFLIKITEVFDPFHLKNVPE